MTYCRFDDLDESVKEDVKFLKESPLVGDGPISGYKVRAAKIKLTRKYDIKTGEIIKVV